MPGKIHLLPDDLTIKIAAGEVVERPASIVKELLENAVDAGATDVSIDLEKGGCGSIRIIDNGEGIAADDLPLAFQRYATSKIYRFDDIYSVRSFGFRGEALPSIASISRVEMLTRKKESLSGTKIIVEAANIREVVEAGCPVGTSVAVSRIFENVPVRKKFLKTETTEQGYCMDVIVRTALSYPWVRIKVVANKREVMNIPATENPAERVALVLGTDFADRMLDVQVKKAGAELSGFASRPDWTRSSSRQIFCYVNRRFVRDYLLNHAVMTAYRRVIEAKKYPAVVLFIELPPEDVDVNVHPAKMEVRFRNPREIYDIIVEGVWGALSRTTAAISETAGYPSSGDKADGREYRARVEEALKRYTVSSGSGKLFFQQGKTASPAVHTYAADQRTTPPVIEEPALPQAEAIPRVSLSELPYLGQIMDTYLVFAAPEGMILVDQHAAHERVLFEKLKGMASSSQVMSQQLLIPEVISLAPRDYGFIMESVEMLAAAGIEVEPFGGDAVVVKSVPAMMGQAEPKALIMDILDEFSGAERTASVRDRKERLLVSLACRGAVKAKQRLAPREVSALCRDLDATAYAATCPHGRPVYISLKTGDLEKMFKRK